jgi:hypothetical protein
MSLDISASVSIPASLAALQLQPQADAPLNATQQRYNALLVRLEALSGQLQRLQAWSDRHRHAHVQALYLAAQQTRALRQDLLLFLHARLQGDALTAQQQRMARVQVRGLIEQLSPINDPKLHALADCYRSAEDEQALAEEQALQAQRLRQQIEAALGQPIHNPGQYQTPEAMMAAGMRQWQQQRQADEARKSAKRAARQERKAHQNPAAHQQAQNLHTDARSAIRTIYRQLASALHPDREPDAQERTRKTTLMSEVNAAYEKNDLSTLLRLQMQVALPGSGAARLADDKLAAMCLLLKEQVAALEDDLSQLEARLTRELCVPVKAQHSEAAMTQALQRLQADQQHEADSLGADLQRIQSEAELKRWLKEQNRALKATSA